MRNIMTEQLPQAGKKIKHSSFTIVDVEADDKGLHTDELWSLARCMIHTIPALAEAKEKLQ